MPCPKCNYKATSEMKRCPVCGARLYDAAAESEARILREREQRERAERERREAVAKARERSEREKKEQEQRAKEQQKVFDSDEPIHVDPKRTFMHDKRESMDDGFGFGSIFDGLFGGSMFGGGFGGRQSGGRRTTIRFGGGGLFDVIDDLFGFGGGGGYGGYIDDNRARIEAPDDFYQIDEYDESGFPIIRKDKLIEVTPHQLEKIRREDEKNPKRKKRGDKH